MGSGAAAVARALPAVFRQRPGRHRADRPVRPAGGGEPGLGELFGAPQQDLIGEPLIGFVTEEDRREVAVKLAAAAEGAALRGRSRCG